jgi:predicted AAA+ superfamily ATPase
MDNYRNRIVDGLLLRKLEAMGAVLIQGAKWCGKTTSAAQVAKSILYMDDPSRREQNINMAELDISLLLSGDTPRLIDEWQLAPQLWDAVRFEVDRRNYSGQFILTGSAVPADTSKIHHSGTGRFTWLTMRPMSLYESGDSTGEVSLKSLFGSVQQVKGESNKRLEDIAFLICRGGWPKSVGIKKEIALELPRDYVDAVVNSDISRADNVSRNPEIARMLMRSYARHQGTQASVSTILEDITGGNSFQTSDKTLSLYISALKQIFVIEDAPAWNPNLRSKTAIRTSHTRFFVDPSIAVAALGLGPDDLINDLNTMGFMFEAMCMRDLRVFADALDGNVYHYRDKYGLECDAVVHLRNGSYGLIEIKLGGEKQIEEGAGTLKMLSSNIDTSKMKSPSFMMVLTAAGGYAYKRKDGVFVVPICCLKD